MSRLDILTEDEAIEAIKRYILYHEYRGFDSWFSWYVGITNDPKRRLYDEHKAAIGISYYVAVESEEVARRVEDKLVNDLKMDGNPGGGENPKFVYTFKKTKQTVPSIG